MIRTDQTPRFGTHVIRGLTVKFNHQSECLSFARVSSCQFTHLNYFKPFKQMRTHAVLIREARFTQIDSSFTSL